MKIASPLLREAHIISEAYIRAHDDYPYHNLEHTRQVYERADYLAEHEGLDAESREDLLVAVLFHDTGFFDRYDDNEIIGAEYAARFLRNQGVHETRINHVRSLVVCTIPLAPATTLAHRIMQESDLDNLGREDAMIRTSHLYDELVQKAGKNLSPWAWLEASLALFCGFQFTTRTGLAEREPMRLRNVEKLRQETERHKKSA